MTKVTRPSLQLRKKHLVKKMSLRQAKRLVSDESTSTSSDDTLPILPPTSPEDSSENDEPPQAAGHESDSSSQYMTSVTDLDSNSSAVAIPENYQHLLNQGVTSLLLLSGFSGVSAQSNGNANGTSDSTVPQISIDMLTGGMLPSGLAQSILSSGLAEGLLPSGLAESLLSGNLAGNFFPNGLAENLPSSLGDLNKSLRSKNFSSGMMNMALLAANGNQLKYLLESADDRPLFIISVSLIGACIVIQIFIKVCLMISSRSDVTDRDQEKKVNLVNKLITYATSLLAFCTFCLTGIAVAEMKGFKL